MEYNQQRNDNYKQQRNDGYRQNRREERFYNSNFSLDNACKDNKDLYDLLKNEEGLVETEDLLYISKELVGTKINEFEDICDDINTELLRGILSYGYENPSRPQSYGIKPIIEGKDLLLQSQSGSGKSGAFIIGAVQSIDLALKKPQVIIISPTGDLALQTHKLCSALTSFMKDFRISLTVGGVPRDQNIRELTDKNEMCQLIIATPGRLEDVLKSNKDISSSIKLLIIDEFDELLSGSFKEKMKEIYKLMSSNMQSCFFSATLTNEVLELSNRIMKNPLKILLKQEEMTLDGIQQTYINCENEDDKLLVIKDLVKTLEIEQFMIYGNTIDKIEYIFEELCNSSDYTERDIRIIHGQMEKEVRNEIIRDFKKGLFKCLISTDLLARGIDVPSLFLVINFDLPNDPSKYIHRIGRSGRFGKKGLSINLINTSINNDINKQTIIKTSFDCKIINFNDYYQNNLIK
jgi:superfamily II DNA/RNA helicase